MAALAQTQGRFLGGRPLYGYLLIDAGPHPNPPKAADGKRLHMLAIDEQAAVVVLRIFDEFLAGRGLYAIAEGLTRDGIPCRRLTTPHATGTAAASPGPKAPSGSSLPTPATPAAESGTASAKTKC